MLLYSHQGILRVVLIPCIHSLDGPYLSFRLLSHMLLEHRVLHFDELVEEREDVRQRLPECRVQDVPSLLFNVGIEDLYLLRQRAQCDKDEF